jgi:hypothetical protein
MDRCLGLWIARSGSIDGSFMLSINRRIQLDSVEMMEAGETIDSK